MTRFFFPVGKTRTCELSAKYWQFYAQGHDLEPIEVGVPFASYELAKYCDSPVVYEVEERELSLAEALIMLCESSHYRGGDCPIRTSNRVAGSRSNVPDELLAANHIIQDAIWGRDLLRRFLS